MELKLANLLKYAQNVGAKLKKTHIALRICGGILLLLIIAVSASPDTTVNNTTNTTSLIASDNFTLVSSELTYDGFGNYVKGTITNNTNKTYSYVEVTFNLYDASGNQIGTAVDNINNFEPRNLELFSNWSYNR